MSLRTGEARRVNYRRSEGSVTMSKFQRTSHSVGNHIPHHINYTDEERQLAALARGISMNRDVLYHGTRTGRSILTTGVLLRTSGNHKNKVCLTRSAEVAAYWSLIEREYDERRPSILIFARKSLECRYQIRASPEVYWHLNEAFHDEAEEKIWDDDVVDVGDHLIGLLSGPWRRNRYVKNSRLANAIRREIEARTKGARS